MEFEDISKPKVDIARIKAHGNTPRRVVELMEPDEYEHFITEWLFLKYSNIQHIGKTGDLGRDIIAWNDDGSCDVYQCKHYSTEFDAGEEILKYVENIQRGAFPLPNCYYFVCLNGLSAKWRDSIINRNLDEVWLDWFRSKSEIFQKKHPGIVQYINEMGFPTIKEFPIDTVINEHLGTIYGKIRFPTDGTIERITEIDRSDRKYISELYKAYSEKSGQKITAENIGDFQNYLDDLNYQRECFFSAESLRVTTEEYILNTVEFDKLKEEMYHGIREV